MAGHWAKFWMQLAGTSALGRAAARIAAWHVPPYYGRCRLARLNVRGYIAPSATIYHPGLQLGRNVFIGERVVVFRHDGGGRVELGDRVHLYGESTLQTGQGGSIRIGCDTHIQPRCQFSAFKASIEIGDNVQIAPGCAFYPYDHRMAAGELIMHQPLTTRGDIRVGNDAWLGFGVIVLSGVRIGEGAVIGAGSVVSRTIPDGAIAVGAPARVVKRRSDIDPGKGKAE